MTRKQLLPLCGLARGQPPAIQLLRFKCPEVQYHFLTSISSMLITRLRPAGEPGTAALKENALSIAICFNASLAS